MFDTFWPNDEYGKYAVGTDIQGLCKFNTLRCAAELAGRPDIVKQQDIDDFVEHQETSCGEELTHGTSWKGVIVFLRRLRDAGRDFIYIVIALDNSALTTIKTSVTLSFSQLRTRTGFIYNLEEGKPIESAEDWIDFYVFIRPSIVFKQE
ncbi:hypothetical protein F441_22135 [Phytophthora nicotianae CJ01A1]|uniref:Uncharacterized protein n=2 Tax=Phytophthora nicotianae TaxID=4792 RepID=W2VQ14_PHYNI|nr:hypothetical protein L916_21497 [Phytophthora nicotianae]ETP00467.1 hypothetical protein F441_22135 [Phytophthora nicotianae CJ01A1]